MTRVLAAVAAAGLGLVLAGSAAAIDYGATEDEVKSDPAGLYPQYREIGFTKSVISVSFDLGDPTALPPESAQIDTLLPIAAANGQKVVFAVYQRRAAMVPQGGPVAVAQFASWLQAVARRFPQVKEFIGLNEPNQPRFWQPQFAPDCTNASGAAYFQAQAAMYDALKSVDPSIKVIGVALSPRGNDNCRAASNVSTSPVRFIKALGDAYRASGRTTPIMDGFSIHPYPNVNTDPPAKGYAWPNIGVPNMARLKQAVWDAFSGTGQPTFGEGSFMAPSTSFKVDLDEVGWQADTAGRPGYSGNENVPVVSEQVQAQHYAQLVRFFACDPGVASLTFFHFVDEADRDRFQSGMLRADRSRRPSFDSVQQAIADTGGRCAGTPVVWRPSRTVEGARALFAMPARNSARRTLWSFRATATEEATYEAGVFLVPKSTKSLKNVKLAGTARPVASAKGTVKANYVPLVRFPAKRLAPGTYVYRVTLRAAMNPSRAATFTSPAFTVG
jgi:hypothetical protein